MSKNVEQWEYSKLPAELYISLTIFENMALLSKNGDTHLTLTILLLGIFYIYALVDIKI